MYGYFSYYPTFPSLSAFSNAQPFPRFAYPAVDTQIFFHSIKSFPPLMEQGSLLLKRLGDTSFAQKIMEAAQQDNKTLVEHLIRSIGLTVPVTTQYTPSSVTFNLHSHEEHHVSCCALSITLKWGR